MSSQDYKGYSTCVSGRDGNRNLRLKFPELFFLWCMVCFYALTFCAFLQRVCDNAISYLKLIPSCAIYY